MNKPADTPKRQRSRNRSAVAANDPSILNLEYRVSRMEERSSSHFNMVGLLIALLTVGLIFIHSEFGLRSLGFALLSASATASLVDLYRQQSKAIYSRLAIANVESAGDDDTFFNILRRHRVFRNALIAGTVGAFLCTYSIELARLSLAAFGA